MIILILFLFGLILGSFLNVLICRYDPDEYFFSLNNIRGRSKCLFCKKKLSWYELVPVLSFILQRRRCRGCKNKISWQYLFVELMSGFIFSVVPVFIVSFTENIIPGVSDILLYIFATLWLLVFIVLLLITFIDRKFFIIPNELNVTLAFLGVAIITAKFFIIGSYNSNLLSFLGSDVLFPVRNLFLSHAVAAISATALFSIFIMASRGRAMGWGDAKLAFVGGLVLGWPDIIFAITMAFIVGGVYGSFVLAMGKNNLGDKVPFAPFIVFGIVITLFFGAHIMDWYLGLLGF